ncbi:MAG: hypothetical protein H5T34_00715 [Candidatus Methanomethyliales bacterium]|nr:hypothetical protein [Candidatus Methanomethylicales archaeon]
MGLLDQIFGPKNATILMIVFKKIAQRVPLTLCLAFSVALLTYTFIFAETIVGGLSLMFMLLLTFFLAVTMSFALEYDSKEELMVLVNLGVSPSDIFKLGIIRVLIISLIGYIVGVSISLLWPLSTIKNVMLFYSFLMALALGVLPPIYSSLRSMRVSLLGRAAFKPLTEKEVPVVLLPSELEEVKDFVKERLKDRQDLLIVDCYVRGAELNLVCRYLGDFGRETFAWLATLGINPDEALRNDETLPIVRLKVSIEEGRNPIMDCWEGSDEKRKKRSAISLSFQALLRQLLIEYKVYKGKLRGAEYHTQST